MDLINVINILLLKYNKSKKISPFLCFVYLRRYFLDFSWETQEGIMELGGYLDV